MVRKVKRPVCVAFAAVCVIASTALGQNAKDDAKAALIAATKTAALESEGTPPFRLTAKFETFDYKGRPASSGTLKEEFLRPGLRRQTVQTGSGPEVYAPEDDVSLEEEPQVGLFVQGLLFGALLHGGPRVQDLDAAPMKTKQVKLGMVAMRCFTVDSSKQANGPQSSTYCLSQDAALLRME